MSGVVALFKAARESINSCTVSTITTSGMQTIYRSSIHEIWQHSFNSDQSGVRSNYSVHCVLIPWLCYISTVYRDLMCNRVLAVVSLVVSYIIANHAIERLVMEPFANYILITAYGQ